MISASKIIDNKPAQVKPENQTKEDWLDSHLQAGNDTDSIQAHIANGTGPKRAYILQSVTVLRGSNNDVIGVAEVWA